MPLRYQCLCLPRATLSGNISETLTLPEFSVEGGERIDYGSGGCYTVIHIGGGSDGEAHTAAMSPGRVTTNE